MRYDVFYKHNLNLRGWGGQAQLNWGGPTDSLTFFLFFIWKWADPTYLPLLERKSAAVGYELIHVLHATKLS
jgi:hypothetical protein